jgi:hypothetical protein
MRSDNDPEQTRIERTVRLPSWKRTLRLALLCLALEAGGVLPGPATAWLASVAGIVAVSSPAAAQSSGGYSRPSGGGSSGGYGGSVRRPSIGGGYARPSASSFGAYGGGFQAYGGGDLAISRRASSQALNNYRAAQAPPPALTSRRPSSGWDDSAWGTAPLQRRPAPAGWGGGAYAPSYGGSAPRFGAWDAVLAWSLLNSLSRPQSVAYFQDNRSDQRYAQWRAEAEREAATDPAVATKLAELDALMTQAKAQPVNSRAAPSDSEGSGVMFVVIFLGAAVFGGLWLLRRRAAAVAGAGSFGAGASRSAGMAPRGLTGSAASRFRVGMTFPVDPAPFLLAAGATKVKPPEAGGMISVEAVGLVADGAVSLHRLYLPGREAFFMLHLGADGTPDECRYFSLLDQVTPTNPDEWGFWLAPADGMIGWPQFQTKDGKTYDRIWAPGDGRAAPRQQVETVQDLAGITQRKIQAMLYGAHTGAPPPAPQVEYVLVCAMEQGDEAWIEVHAGIDINPAGLALPAVPLDS